MRLPNRAFGRCLCQNLDVIGNNIANANTVGSKVVEQGLPSRGGFGHRPQRVAAGGRFRASVQGFPNRLAAVSQAPSASPAAIWIAPLTGGFLN